MDVMVCFQAMDDARGAAEAQVWIASDDADDTGESTYSCPCFRLLFTISVL